MRKSKVPKIEYICIADKNPKESEDRMREAYFILFEEVERRRREKEGQKKQD